MLNAVKEAVGRAVAPAAQFYELMREHEEDPRISEIRVGIADMEGHVLDSLTRSISALRNRDAALADSVVAGDDRIDFVGQRLQQQCTNLLASGGLTPGERNFMLTAMPIETALERIADQAVEIAVLAREMSLRLPFNPPGMLWDMANVSKDMVASSLAALCSENAQPAHELCAQKKRVASYHTEVAASVMSRMNADTRFTTQGIYCMFVVNHIKRIADLASNMSERVICWQTGDLHSLSG